MNNIAGQVVHPNTGEVVAGEYVVGWAKRGPPAGSGTTSLIPHPRLQQW
jgi:hypothetical protein